MIGRLVAVVVLIGVAAGAGVGIVRSRGAAGAAADAARFETTTIAVAAVAGFPATTMPAEVHRPPGPGPFPVVVFSHGRAVARAERAGLAHPIPAGHARYWTAKGFAVVAPIRPGYGPAGGVDREGSGLSVGSDAACRGRDRLEAAGAAATGAIVAAVDWARRQPWADRDHILLVGQSVGGFATILAAAEKPPGVVGFVDFSGGAAGFPRERPGASCGEAAIGALFRRAGTRVTVPSLWLYAENDRYWGSAAPKAWFSGFAAGGSPGRFVTTAPVPGDDGHRLLSRGGRLWSAHVDPFVAGLGLGGRAAVSSPGRE